VAGAVLYQNSRLDSEEPKALLNIISLPARHVLKIGATVAKSDVLLFSWAAFCAIQVIGCGIVFVIRYWH
jgi:hypothetical protein